MTKDGILEVEKSRIREKFSAFLFFLFLCFAPVAVYAEEIVAARLVSEVAAIDEGKKVRLGLLLDQPEGWHTYTKVPGDAGLPTKIKWQLPEGFVAGEIEWPQAETFSEDGLTTYGYKGRVLLPVTVSIPAELSESLYSLKATASWLVCKDICIPESRDLEIVLSVGEMLPSADADLFPKLSQNARDALPDSQGAGADFSLFAILFTAMLGGLILNIMPCVLPVLSLKTLALVKKSGKAREHTVIHGISYTLGILASFAAIAGVLISLQQAGSAIGWGFQMQSPAFVGFLIYLLFLVGLSLSGAFHLPVLLGGVGGGVAGENSLRGSFFTGVLATLVATPCTAPFMASAVGAALAMPAWSAMLVFLALGFGLALPFLLISIFPGLLRFLPKPGAWMEKFKEFLAFPMYGAVIWLVWVLGMQIGSDGVALTLCGLLLIVFAIWLKDTRPHHQIIYYLITAILLGFTLFSLAKIEEGGAEIEQAYSAGKLAELRAQGKAVYVDATAAWCITCQINKRIALNTPRSKQAFADNDVTLLIADWTRKDPEITAFLREFGYNGVPLNVFYPQDGGKPVVMPQILSEDAVVRVIEGR